MPAPLLHYPAVREAPAAVLAELRAVDPRAELLHVEGTRWLLGTVRPGDPGAVRQGITQIASARRWLTRGSLLKIRLGHALLQGFKPVEEYQVRNDMDFGRIVADFRERDWRFRNRFLEEGLAREEATDIDTERRATLARSLSHFEARAHEAYRYAFRGARSFLQPGVTWGRKATATA